MKDEWQLYVMTRMGFGVSVTPKIMSRIVSHVLAQDDQVKDDTDYYNDDIWINEEVVQVKGVKQLLEKYDIIIQKPDNFNISGVLGLRVKEDEDSLFVWQRDGVRPVLSDNPNKCKLLSGWLITACSYVQKQGNGVL